MLHKFLYSYDLTFNFLVPRNMLETACDRIEQFCKDHYPVINRQQVVPRLRHQQSMAVMVMETDTPSSSDEDEPIPQFKLGENEELKWKRELRKKEKEMKKKLKQNGSNPPKSGVTGLRRLSIVFERILQTK